MGKFFDIETIYAYRAIFRTVQGDDVLREHGLFRDKVGPKNRPMKTKVLRTVASAAQPGYAVGGVTLRSGLLINGLSLTFMRMKDGKLDPQDSYESDWVGDRTGGGEAYMGGDGAPVVGILGSQDDEHARRLGLYFTMTRPPPSRRPWSRRQSPRRRPSCRRPRRRGNRLPPQFTSRILPRRRWPTRPSSSNSRRRPPSRSSKRPRLR